MIETLLNALGTSLAWAGALAAVPIVVAGLILRRSGRSRVHAFDEARASARSTRDVQPGPVALRGTLRRTPDGTLVEDAHGRVRLVGADVGIADGTAVVVLGAAIEEEPESAGYRVGARRWVVDARGGFVSARTDALERAGRAARVRALAGAMLFASGLALAAGGWFMSWHAADAVVYDPSE